MAGLGSPERAGPAPVPATRVELTVSCRQLLDRDTFSKSDPVCVLYTQCPGSNQWREFGRTEVIDNSLNPDFLHKFVLDYCFEERQNLRFDLYDVDSKSPDLSKHDFLGQAFCTLGEIVGSAGSRLEKPLMMGTATMHPRGRRPSPASSSGGVPGKKCGTIILLAEELGNCRDVATLQFSATKLDKKDFFGKSDPFMVFYRSNEDGTFTICHKTEVVRNTLNPIWAAFAIPVRALCNGDHDRAIKVEVYDWDRDGSHDFIGEFTTSYRELARGQSHFNVYEVVNPRKKMKKKKYLNSGTVTLLSFAVEAEHTFLDYIRGGTQLNFTVAIDFTASNERGCIKPGMLWHHRGAGGISVQPAPCPALRPHQLCPCCQPCCPLSGHSAGWVPVLCPPHHYRWCHLRHGPDQGGHCQCETLVVALGLPNCPCPSSSWELARQSLMPWWSWMGTTSASLPVGKWLSVISSRYRPHQCAIWGPPSSPTSKVVGDSLGTSNQRHHSWGALGGTGV
ncbi:copine-5-like isoform X10 [Hirundo rustica]|uniref:copine-5-like isoform X10 n=1 Tax=Hirundo rustica TaxID=43150 RepID=UPI002672EDD2|nr:copine-5-like isoform X10 [Hirundo rustica]